MTLDPLELVATAFGLACVWLAVKRSIWTWPTGLVMVSLYIVIFGRAKLYSDMGLQVVYVGLQIYGWWHWLHGGRDRDELPVTRLRPAGVLVWTAVCVAGTGTLGWVMATRTDAALPYPDAATTVTSLVAQWLMARKVLENWSFWIAVDAMAIGVYLVKGLYPTAVLYAVFLGMCVVGLREWRASMESTDAAPPPVDASRWVGSES